MAKTKTQPEEKLEVLVLDAFQETKNELAKFVADYQNLVVTEDNLAEGRQALATIRDKRYSIQNTRKENDKQRIAWNKKYAASNEAKETELVSVLIPTEEAIEKQVKAIEEQKAIEKAKREEAKKAVYNGRVKRLADIGAELVESGYLLDDQFLSFQEIEVLEDNSFEKCFLIFQQTANDIQAKIDAENKRLADLAILVEKQKKEEADKLAEDQRILKEQQDAQAEKERIFNEKQDAILKEQAEKQRLIDEAEKKIADEKRKLAEQRLKSRKSSLFSLGMALNGQNFTFNNDEIIVAGFNLEKFDEEEWNQCHAHCQVEISKIKIRIEAETIKAKAEKEEQEKQAKILAEKRAESLKSDIDRLEDYANKILLPEFDLTGLSEDAINVALEIKSDFITFKNSIRNLIHKI